jgi:uncharacterized FlgJ-related protein
MATLVVGYKTGVSTGKKAQITEKDVVLIFNDLENTSFTPKKFYEYLKKVNIKFPEIVFAQSMKECGFKSSLFKNNNNLFGMREASRRPNLQSDIVNGYGYYDNWKLSVVDYALYQSNIGVTKLKTEDQYLEFIKEMGYFDVDHPNNVTYLSDVKSIAKNIERYIKE